MTRGQQVRRIAAWEFNRFVKWRQQVIGIVTTLVVGSLAGGVGKLVKNARTRDVRVAVVGATALGFALPAVEGVQWVPEGYASDRGARAAVAADSVAGALLVRDATTAEILVRERAAWTASV